jgi:hypothetical protein
MVSKASSIECVSYLVALDIEELYSELMISLTGKNICYQVTFCHQSQIKVMNKLGLQIKISMILAPGKMTLIQKLILIKILQTIDQLKSSKQMSLISIQSKQSLRLSLF